MSDGARPDHPNPAPGLALRLPADAYYELVRTLRLTLPPPLSDNPDDLARRDHAAIARVAALVPANAAEADLAALFVAASDQWKDCLRLAQLPATTAEVALKCRAQAISMMRQAQGAVRLLLRLQEARGTREADSAACNSAAWTEHCAIGLMAEALAPAPPSQCPPVPAIGGDTVVEPPPQPMPQPQPEPACPGAEQSGVAEAEHYAALHPERAPLIRRMGRLPEPMSFGPRIPGHVSPTVQPSRPPRNETPVRMPAAG